MRLSNYEYSPAGRVERDVLQQGVRAFAGCRVLIVGDVMLDEYLTGEAERISPEAPVPVVRVTGESHLAGGAGNVARNINALGGQAVLVGVCGRDMAAQSLGQCLDQEGITSVLLDLPDRPTTIKTRVLARQQQVVRIDRETAQAHSEAEVRQLLAILAAELPKCGAVVLSDYGKGVISPGLMCGLQELLRKQERSIAVLLDPKPQNIGLYAGVTLLTPNAKETSESVNMPVSTPEEILDAGRAIIDRLGCPHLVTTLGRRGMAVFVSPDEVWHIPTSAQQVFDVTGAGDTVIATLALGAAANLPLVTSCLLANYAAGIVVGKVGAATADPDGVTAVIASSPEPVFERWR